MVKINVIKLDGKWGCFDSNKNLISLNRSLLKKHQSKAWVLSVLAHEYTHYKMGHSKKDCPEYEYLAQSVANAVLCKKYKYNSKNALFKKNDVSLAKWKKQLPKGAHYGLKLKAKKLADEFWNSDEFWKLFKTVDELGGIQVKDESPNTIGGSVSKIQVAQPGEPDCKACKQGVNTTPAVENKKEVLNMSNFLNLSRKDRKRLREANKNLAYSRSLVKNNKALVKEFLELVPGSIQLKAYPAFWQKYLSVDYTDDIKNLEEIGEFICYMRDKNLYGEDAIDINDYDIDVNESDVIERYIRKGDKTSFKIPKSWFYSLKLHQVFDTNICEQVQIFEDFEYGWKNEYTGLEFKCSRLEFWQPQKGDNFLCLVVGSNLTYNQLDRFVYEVEKYWSMKYNDKRTEDLRKKLRHSEFEDSNLKYYRGKVLFEDDQEKLSKLRELYLKDGEDDLLQQIVKSSRRGAGELSQVPLEVLEDWIEILEKIEFNSYGSSWTDFFIMDWEVFGPDLIPLREKRISLRNLYHKGNVELLKSSIVGVTGGREAPEEELAWLKEQIKLLPKGTVVMTGLADGADKVATETALECGLSVIGVIPYGMKNHGINKRIVKRILKSKGLILSRSNGRNSATPESYISRDKIIAQADAMIATSGGNGTNATIAFASANSVPIKRYGEDEEVIKEKAGITPGIPAELRSIMYQYFAKLDICEVIDALKGQYKKTLDFYEPTPMDEVRTSYEEFFDVKKDHKAVYDKHQEYVVAKKYRGYKPWWIEEDINEVFPGLQEILGRSANHKKALQSDLKKTQYKIIEVGKERMKPDYDGGLEELDKYLRNKYLSLKEEIANHH